MKHGYRIILAASTAILLVTAGQPSFGENTPTQDEIVRALRPVPQALQQCILSRQCRLARANQ